MDLLGHDLFSQMHSAHFEFPQNGLVFTRIPLANQMLVILSEADFHYPPLGAESLSQLRVLANSGSWPTWAPGGGGGQLLG